MSDKRSVPALISVMTVTGMMLAGCTAGERGDNKAGGSAEPIVLKMADAYSGFNYEPAVQYFVDQVETLSDGAIRIDASHQVGGFAVDAEQQIVRSVATGEFDVAWVGTRVFDTLGVNSLRALTAPMLIDSYPLQKAVIDSALPADMLAELDQVGVTGIAVLADGLRKPIAVDHPLLSPADFDGITFQSFRSTTQAAAIRALGANPIETGPGELEKGLGAGAIQGYEKSLHIYSVNETWSLAPYVTANVNLWPQTAALIANPDTLDDLTDTERDWLMQAGAAAAVRSTDLVDDDADTLTQLCGVGSRFANASDADLAALREAFTPVYASLEEDPETKEFIDRITELKESTDPGSTLSVPSGCTGRADENLTRTPGTEPPNDGSANPAAAALLNGVYRWTLTEADSRVHDTHYDAGDDGWLPAVATMNLEDGRWELSWRGADGSEWIDGPATYSVDGDQLRFDWPQDPVGSLSFTYEVDDDGSIALEPVAPMDSDARFVWAFYTWHKIAGDSHEPAGDQSVLNGVYRYEITDDDIRDAGAIKFGDDANDGIWTWTLEDGQFDFEQRSADVTDHRVGTYEITDDQIEFFIPGEFEQKAVFTWQRDDDGSIQLTAGSDIDRLYVAVFTTKAWERIDSAGEVDDTSDAERLDGVYRRAVTEAALTAAGVDAPTAQHEAGLYTLTLENGRFTWSTRNEFDLPDCEGTFTVSGQRVTLVNENCGAGPFFSSDWSIEGRELRFNNVETGLPEIAESVGGGSWERLD